jgi:DNA-binding MarR family transcriptional regulator
MRQELHQFIRLLRELQKIDSEFPLQYAVCLSEIALEEGLSLTDLADRTGMPLSTISRIITALSKHSNRGTSYGLVKVSISAEERRKKEIFLTAKGRAIVNSVSDIILDISKSRSKIASRK